MGTVMSTYPPTPMSPKIVVIGAINIDLSIHPTKPYVLHDSNVVDMDIAVGGVGANIAQNLACLGHDVMMITTIGTNPFYSYATTTLTDMGIEVASTIPTTNVPTNFYISVLDDQQDLYLGLNDMKGIESLQVDDLKSLDIDWSKLSYLILDNNIPVDVLEYATAQASKATVVLDAVSAEKAPNVLTVLANLTILKLNQLEYDTVVARGFDPGNHPNLTTIVTNHEHPIRILQHQNIGTVTPPTVTSCATTSGAGDALLSGVVDGLIQGFPIADAVQRGIQLAQHVMTLPTSSLKERYDE